MNFVKPRVINPILDKTNNSRTCVVAPKYENLLYMEWFPIALVFSWYATVLNVAILYDIAVWWYNEKYTNLSVEPKILFL